MDGNLFADLTLGKHNGPVKQIFLRESRPDAAAFDAAARLFPRVSSL